MAASSAVRRAATAASAVKSVRQLGFPFETLDPFLFCVHHRDLYPEGTDKMGPKGGARGNGMDFDWNKPYRMYHGETIPGFPQHPHRGFETLTATLQGYVDHTDSMGCAGRYGGGDLQWMTAGSGIVHGENFPCIHRDRDNHMELFQIWLNLPSKHKMVEPYFTMHWRENIERANVDGSADDGKHAGKTEVIVWAGELLGKKGQAPPPDSWASQEESDVAVWHLAMQPGAKFTLPPAAGGSGTNRALYFYEGGELTVENRDIPNRHLVEVDAGQEVVLRVPGRASEGSCVLVLQGRPIGEPVAQRGPFVMNTQKEIQQAIFDYQRTQFGGWPWDSDAVSFPREKGRFALQKGEESYPPLDKEVPPFKGDNDLVKMGKKD